MNIFRSFEAKGRIDYLTNMDSLRENRETDFQGIQETPSTSQTEVTETHEVIGSQEKEVILKGIRTKLLILKYSIIMFYLSVNSYHLISCPLFIYNQRPHMITCILSVVNMFVLFYVHYIANHFLLNIYTSYILTVDYFSARIEFMMKWLKQEILFEVKMTRVLFLYNQLMNDFAKQDYVLKYLLRNMMYGYCAGLTVIFILFSIDMNPFLRIFILTGLTVLSLTMLSSGLYVGRLHSKTLDLYGQLNGIAARNCRPIKSYNAFKTRRLLLNCIKEIGSQQTDGQYVFGVRDGMGLPFLAWKCLS